MWPSCNRCARRSGPDIAVRADADGVWTPEWAIDLIRRLEPFNLEFVEQPVMDRDLSGMARVRRSVSTPIAADEPVTGVAEAQRVIDAAAADVLVVKLAGAGGIRNAQTIMELARAHGLGRRRQLRHGDRRRLGRVAARGGVARVSVRVGTRHGDAARARPAHDPAVARARATSRSRRCRGWGSTWTATRSTATRQESWA